MIIFKNLMILVYFFAKAQADTCVVGVDGCSWTCAQSGLAICMARPATPTSCTIGSSETVCGTTCTCSEAETCTVGEDGCSWDCEAATPEQGVATCDARPGTPKTCVVDSSETVCATTCTCSQVEKCTVGVNGCDWSCVTSPTPADEMTCDALPATPTECYPGETSSVCGRTCTCTLGKS